MKGIIIFLLICISVVYGHPQQTFDVKENLRNELRDHLMKLLEVDETEPQLQTLIIALMNEYLDKVYANLEILVDKDGLNRIDLPTEAIDLNPGHLYLDAGLLVGLDHFNRGGDAVVEYQNDTKKLSVIIPLTFVQLTFTYVYNAKVPLINAYGGVEGVLRQLQFYIQLSFEFNNYTFILDSFAVTNIGTFSLEFSGNDAIDWLLDSMSKSIIKNLEPKIITAVQNLVTEKLNELIEVINEEIAKILTPPTATLPNDDNILIFYNN